MRTIFACLLLASALGAQTYDFVLRGAEVIDPKNNLNRELDVAIAGGKIAAVAPSIPTANAKQVIDVSGLIVTPGLIDIHAHVCTRCENSLVPTSALNVQPDAFSFRAGVTTMVDAGSVGWRDFADFRKLVVDQSRTRVLSFLNINGGGMGTGHENDPADMDPEAAARTARENADVIVGFKSAHYEGPGWISVDNALKAGGMTGLPVMVDFGRITEERTIRKLFLEKLRPGDIYTHCYSGHREELLADDKLNPAMWAGRKRGIIFDLGHGGGSFYWYVAVPAYEQGFFPDSISTDLHSGSMNAGMKDMLNVMSKALSLGSSLERVIRMSTWNPANEIHRRQLGNLDVGGAADIAVLRLERGNFGFVDSAGARRSGSAKLVCELTVRDGKVVWDLNGVASKDWKEFKYDRESWKH